MADNDKFDDEYQFVDPDSGNAGFTEYNPEAGTGTNAAETVSPVKDTSVQGKTTVVRKGLVVVVIVMVAMAVYPFIRTAMSIRGKGKPASTVASIPMKKVPALPSPEPVHVSALAPAPLLKPAAEPVPAPVPSEALSEQVTQKLSALESTQERMQSEFVSTNNQLNGINSNISEMMVKVTELNRAIALYAAKAEEQERIIARMTAEAEALKKARARPPVKRVAAPVTKYYIQAVIPGRAWIIASNGSTLTVREGTMIPGLGMVKLIDARQGRVITGSGRVIRFSQEDS